jgi:hypothetical protein
MRPAASMHAPAASSLFHDSLSKAVRASSRILWLSTPARVDVAVSRQTKLRELWHPDVRSRVVAVRVAAMCPSRAPGWAGVPYAVPSLCYTSTPRLPARHLPLRPAYCAPRSTAAASSTAPSVRTRPALLRFGGASRAVACRGLRCALVEWPVSSRLSGSFSGVEGALRSFAALHRVRSCTACARKRYGSQGHEALVHRLLPLPALRVLTGTAAAPPPRIASGAAPLVPASATVARAMKP